MISLYPFFFHSQIAQVHRATLNDGQNVVVKVQHDGIKEIILEVGNSVAFMSEVCSSHIIASGTLLDHQVCRYFAGSEECKVNN